MYLSGVFRFFSGLGWLLDWEAWLVFGKSCGYDGHCKGFINTFCSTHQSYAR